MADLSGSVSITGELSGEVSKTGALSGDIAIIGLQNTLETYNWPPPTGQTTEYAEFDDAWQYFNIWKPIFEAEAGKKRIVPRLLDLFTLVDNNSFGNKNRFTDINGNVVNEANPANDKYFIDHYTGLGFQFFPNETSRLWADNIDFAFNYVHPTLGYNDYYLPNISQSFYLGGNFNKIYGYEFINGTNILTIHSVTTNSFNSSDFYLMFDNNNFGGVRQVFRAKGGQTTEPFIYRKHF